MSDRYDRMALDQLLEYVEEHIEELGEMHERTVFCEYVTNRTGDGYWNAKVTTASRSFVGAGQSIEEAADRAREQTVQAVRRQVQFAPPEATR